MSKEMTALKFLFLRNGETWTINCRHIGASFGPNKSQQVLTDQRQ